MLDKDVSARLEPDLLAVNLFHLLFNMLAVWMFGVELQRAWGTRAFTTYYLVTGLGAEAGATSVVTTFEERATESPAALCATT